MYIFLCIYFYNISKIEYSIVMYSVYINFCHIDFVSQKPRGLCGLETTFRFARWKVDRPARKKQRKRKRLGGVAYEKKPIDFFFHRILWIGNRPMNMTSFFGKRRCFQSDPIYSSIGPFKRTSFWFTLSKFWWCGSKSSRPSAHFRHQLVDFLALGVCRWQFRRWMSMWLHQKLAEYEFVKKDMGKSRNM